MIIAGWADGYRNNTFRVIEQYERNGLPWRLLAGPWVHKSPDSRAARARTSTTTSRSSRSSTSTCATGRAVEAAPRAGVRPCVRSMPEPDLAFHPGVWRRRRHLAAGRSASVEFRPGRDRHRRARGARRRGRRRVELVRRRRCRGGSRSTSATTTPGRSPTTGRSTETAEIVGNGSGRAAGSDRPGLRSRQRQAVRRVPRRHVGADHTRHARPHPRRMLAGRRARRGRQVAAAARARRVDRRRDRSRGDDLDAPSPVTRCASRSPAPTGRTAGRRPVRSRSRSIASRTRARRCRSSTGCRRRSHHFAPGGRPSDDEADGVEWRIEHDVLGRETRVVTRYGGTYEGWPRRRRHRRVSGRAGRVDGRPRRRAGRVARRDSRSRWPEVTVRTEAHLSITSDAERFEVEMTLVVGEDGNRDRPPQLDNDRSSAEPVHTEARCCPAIRSGQRVAGRPVGVAASRPARRRRRCTCRRMPSRSASPDATTGQRGWNRQPAGMRLGSGVSPVRICCSTRSISGTTDSSALVYGCCGSASTSSAVPISTIRPRYITAIRSAMFQASPRSWVTAMIASPCVVDERTQQRQDLAADRGVERCHRLVGEEQRGARAPSPRRSAPADAGHPRSRAGSAP